MTKRLVFLFTFLFASSSLWAQIDGEDFVLSAKIDEESGILIDDYNISEDKRRWTISYLANPNTKELADIATFEFIFAQKREFAWIEYSLSRTSGTFRELAAYNPNWGLSQTQQRDLQETSDSVLTLGIGLSFRSAYIQHILSGDWFEIIGASLTYHQFDEAFQEFTFTGPGIKADLGIQKRTSESYFWGVRGSYHLASLRRSAEQEGEASEARSLLLHWVSVGFDVGIYY